MLEIQWLICKFRIRITRYIIWFTSTSDEWIPKNHWPRKNNDYLGWRCVYRGCLFLWD